MSNEIEIIESVASKVVEVHITEPRPSGWMAWYRHNSNGHFNQVFDTPGIKMDRNNYRCPYPLFHTREDAIDAARYVLRDQGGEVRVVQVTL